MREQKQVSFFLFFIQIFSTLSFSVLYSTLTLYTSQGLGFSTSVAIGITGSFVAFNYFLHLLGGYVGGRLLSYRMLFALGMIIQTFGCVILYFNTIQTFYWGLALFLTGTGMNVTCINCLLTQMFEAHDKRRESAFLWNYSGMNIGFLIGFTMSGFFQIHRAYPKLFLLTALANLVALFILCIKWKLFRDRETHLVHKNLKQQWIRGCIGCLIALFVFLLLHILLLHAKIGHQLILGVGILMGLLIVGLALQRKKEASKKLWAFLILILAAFVFWILYLMGPMGLILFITHNIDRTVFGFKIPPQWFGNINTLMIIIGGPLMAIFYQKLRRKGVQISIALQFMIALFCIGFAFVVLPIGVHFASNTGLSSLYWIVIAYVLLTVGELFISPIGYAMIGQLVPKKLQGLMTGIWLMNTGVAATLSNKFSQLIYKQAPTTNPLESNPYFIKVFNLLGWGAVIVACLFAMLVPLLNRLIKEKYPHTRPHPYHAIEETFT